MEEMSEVTACCKLNVRGEAGYHLNALHLFSFRTFLVRIIDLVQPQSTSIWYLGSGFEFISFTRLFTPSDFINIALKKIQAKNTQKNFGKLLLNILYLLPLEEKSVQEEQENCQKEQAIPDEKVETNKAVEGTKGNLTEESSSSEK